MDWICMGKHLPDECVSDFMDSSETLLILCHTKRFLLVTHHDFLDRLLDHRHGYTFHTFLTSKYSCFIEQIAELSTRESDSDTRDLIPVHIRAKWLSPRMDFEDLLTIFEGWEIDRDTSIESSWSKKGLVEDICTIRRCHHDHIGLVIESIHLSEDLVQSLLTLIMAATDTR